MNHLDLFSGIGGFSLAARNVWGYNHNIVAFVEQDKYCQKVLNKHWPDVPIFDDIKEYKYAGTETIDLLTGGFPCQPFSVAGKQRGKEDDRFLWHEMLRIIKEAKPRWIIGENVPGIINMELDNCITELESEGYEVQTLNIGAVSVDARHKRQRIWIVSNASSIRQQGQGQRINSSNKEETREGEASTVINDGIGAVWPVEPSVGRVANGIPNSLHRTIRRYGYEDGNTEKAITAIDLTRRSILQKMWCDQNQVEPTSLRIETENYNDSMSEVSCLRAYEEWKLGQRIKENQDLWCMWKHICSKSFKKTQVVQFKMLVRIREIECNEKVVSDRTERIKGLGNAIVPQVVMPIMQCIKELSK